MKLKHTIYSQLSSRQMENFSFQKVSAIPADYGFSTIRLSADWQSADFIAQHLDGKTFLKVQLKGSLTFSKKYEGKDLWITFPERGRWYLYPHDTLLAEFLAQTNMGNTKSWRERGGYSFPYLGRDNERRLQKYLITPASDAIEPSAVSAGEQA